MLTHIYIYTQTKNFKEIILSDFVFSQFFQFILKNFRCQNNQETHPYRQCYPFNFDSILYSFLEYWDGPYFQLYYDSNLYRLLHFRTADSPRSLALLRSLAVTTRRCHHVLKNLDTLHRTHLSNNCNSGILSVSSCNLLDASWHF